MARIKRQTIHRCLLLSPVYGVRGREDPWKAEFLSKVTRRPLKKQLQTVKLSPSGTKRQDADSDWENGARQGGGVRENLMGARCSRMYPASEIKRVERIPD